MGIQVLSIFVTLMSKNQIQYFPIVTSPYVEQGDKPPGTDVFGN